MKIEGVVISCYPADLHLTRICVASVRFWYPDVPIWLLKDRQYGDFDTTELERCWNAQVFPGRNEKLGWGFGKLELMTESPARRFLLLDSDTAFVGRVIDRLELFDADLVVDKEDFPPDAIPVQFFPIDKLRQLDPEFVFPGYGFNTGQMVATTGCISKSDFDGLLDWQTRAVMHRDVFQKGEQGLFNYVVLRQAQKGRLSIHREPFMVWPGEASLTAHIRVADLTPDSPHAQVIHWAGLGWGRSAVEMPRPDILSHFEALYYSRVPNGALIQKYRRVELHARRSFLGLKRTARSILSKSQWRRG